jgi:hypothetical protein
MQCRLIVKSRGLFLQQLRKFELSDSWSHPKSLLPTNTNTLTTMNIRPNSYCFKPLPRPRQGEKSASTPLPLERPCEGRRRGEGDAFSAVLKICLRKNVSNTWSIIKKHFLKTPWNKKCVKIFCEAFWTRKIFCSRHKGLIYRSK